MPATFTLGPGYPLRFIKGGLGSVFSFKWVGEKDPVIRSGESEDQFCFFHVRQAWPDDDDCFYYYKKYFSTLDRGSMRS